MPVMPERSTIKMARGSSATTSGVATILMEIPSGGRKIAGGHGWFDSPAAGDWAEIYITDEDNILGGGAGAVVGSYTDTDLQAGSQGWFINQHSGFTAVDAMGSPGVLSGGLYVKIVGHKASGEPEDTFRVNIKWGYDD